MAQTATRNLGRLSEIAQVAVRHGFGYWFDTHRLTDLFPRRAARDEVDGQPSQRGQHLREMLDELGPTFVKFGQLLSTRPDVIPPDIVAELRGLQDDASPIPFEQVRDVVEAELDLRMDRAFLEFDFAPQASASIGQVRNGFLASGERTRGLRVVTSGPDTSPAPKPCGSAPISPDGRCPCAGSRWPGPGWGRCSTRGWDR